jgi:MYXO-CTERM domain-containing protein
VTTPADATLREVLIDGFEKKRPSPDITCGRSPSGSTIDRWYTRREAPSPADVVASGGACALGSPDGEAPPAAALLVAAAGLLARARRRRWLRRSLRHQPRVKPSSTTKLKTSPPPTRQIWITL